jgi:hypothetical protein
MRIVCGLCEPLFVFFCDYKKNVNLSVKSYNYIIIIKREGENLEIVMVVISVIIII